VKSLDWIEEFYQIFENYIEIGKQNSEMTPTEFITLL